jgi:MFS family permease
MADIDFHPQVLVGAAGPFGKITAIALLHEIAHPRLRPIVATSFYCNYYIGSTAAAWFCYGSLHWGDSNWSWRAPCLFQIFAPLVGKTDRCEGEEYFALVADFLKVLTYLFFIPESPRYLIRHDKMDKALDILATYHANGRRDDELVEFEINEIKHAIQLEEESKRTRYVDFVKTSGNRRRLLVIFTLATVSINLRYKRYSLSSTDVV